MKTSDLKARKSQGLSLIEVLVGILLISFGLLGLISLLSRSIQFSVSAEDSQRAALLASELATSVIATNTDTTGDLVINNDMVLAWQAEVANPAGKGLPNGSGTITANGKTARITVQWRPPQAASGAESTYVTDVVIP